VRRSFLCGKDRYTGRDFTHRRGWVEQRLLLLAEVFNIDVFAYAVMHNHTHLLLHVDIESNRLLDDLEVLRRWAKIRKLDPLCMRCLVSGECEKLTHTERLHVKNAVKQLRDRLVSISWFMSLLNHYIARKANKEDECTGRFWEGRFKSQALLTNNAVLACLAYVDLNPIRAGVSNCLLNSEYTSIRRRLNMSCKSEESFLCPIVQRNSKLNESYLSTIKLSDYVNHLYHVLKCAKQKDHLSRARAFLEKEAVWIKNAHNFEAIFGYMAGDKSNMRLFRNCLKVGEYRLQI
jgi:REP element-mobilizing transposase RayT